MTGRKGEEKKARLHTWRAWRRGGAGTTVKVSGPEGPGENKGPDDTDESVRWRSEVPTKKCRPRISGENISEKIRREIRGG